MRSCTSRLLRVRNRSFHPARRSPDAFRHMVPFAGPIWAVLRACGGEHRGPRVMGAYWVGALHRLELLAADRTHLLIVFT